MFNIHYKGKPVLKYWRKILEIPLQIALLPISIFVTICGFLCFTGLGFVGEDIVDGFFFKMKKENRVIVSRYNVGESQYTYDVTKKHEIKDKDDNVIATYETIEKETQYDDGDRVTYNYPEWQVWVYVFFALPLRLFSLLAAIFALFVPKMYVSAIYPNNKKNCFYYNNNFYRFTDVIVLD